MLRRTVRLFSTVNPLLFENLKTGAKNLKIYQYQSEEQDFSSILDAFNQDFKKLQAYKQQLTIAQQLHDLEIKNEPFWEDFESKYETQFTSLSDPDLLWGAYLLTKQDLIVSGLKPSLQKMNQQALTLPELTHLLFLQKTYSIEQDFSVFSERLTKIHMNLDKAFRENINFVGEMIVIAGEIPNFSQEKLAELVQNFIHLDLELYDQSLMEQEFQEKETHVDPLSYYTIHSMLNLVVTKELQEESFFRLQEAFYRKAETSPLDLSMSLLFLELFLAYDFELGIIFRVWDMMYFGNLALDIEDQTQLIRFLTVLDGFEQKMETRAQIPHYYDLIKDRVSGEKWTFLNKEGYRLLYNVYVNQEKVDKAFLDLLQKKF